MTGPAIFVLTILSAGIMFGSRRAATFFLVAGACFVPLGDGVAIGPFTFHLYRLLLVVGLLRILLRTESPVRGNQSLDRWMLWWAVAALLTALFHEDARSTVINRAGMVFTAGATYLLLRAWCRDLDDVRAMVRGLALMLVPLALAMAYEALNQHNLFAAIGGVPDVPEVRDGRVRAQGPFGHAILAGTFGATSLPLIAIVWQRSRTVALLGTAACAVLILASASSSPILCLAVATTALLAWPLRNRMRVLRWGLVFAYLGLEVVMNAPAYYVLAWIDVTGSSASWHRAALIEAAIEHFPDWWLVGTDHTHHWLAYGGLWQAGPGSHADITNQYIRMGVDGGLPLLFAYLALIAAAFTAAGRSRRALHECARGGRSGQSFVPWALGCALVTHLAAFLAVSYFDQSVVFFHAVLATVAACAASTGVRSEASEDVLNDAAGPSTISTPLARQAGVPR